ILTLKLLGVLLVNWFIKDIGVPPAGADGKGQMGAEPGDRPAYGGKPANYNKCLSSLIATFATLWYGSLYWNSQPLGVYEIVGFVFAITGYALRQWACYAL